MGWTRKFWGGGSNWVSGESKKTSLSRWHHAEPVWDESFLALLKVGGSKGFPGGENYICKGPEVRRSWCILSIGQSNRRWGWRGKQQPWCPWYGGLSFILGTRGSYWRVLEGDIVPWPLDDQSSLFSIEKERRSKNKTLHSFYIYKIGKGEEPDREPAESCQWLWKLLFTLPGSSNPTVSPSSFGC